MSTITGTNDGDELLGTSGDDTINGLGSGDVLVGLEGDDTLNGGDGNDIFLGGEGTDTYNGGAGRDVLFFSYVNGFDSDFLTDDLTIDVQAGTASFAGITEHFTSIEKFYLGGGNDTFYGSDQDDDVLAVEGDDTLHGGAGNDLLKGATGDDVIYGDDGNDTLDGGNGQDMVYGGAGDDTIVLGGMESAAPDTLDGGAGFDTLRVDSSPYEYTSIFAGSTITGMESIEGAFTETNSTNPTLDWETSVRVQFDAVFFRNNNISTVVSNAHDFDNWHFAITVAMGDETTLDLSALQFDENWNDFTPNGEVGDSVTITGGDASETIVGSEVSDTIDAGGGDDTINGGLGDDRLTGGAGADRFVFSRGAGHDTITDFTSQDDLIVLDGYSLAEFNTAFFYHNEFDGNNVTLTFADGASLKFEGIAPYELTQYHFTFAEIPNDSSTDAEIIRGETFSSNIADDSDSDWLGFSVSADEYFVMELSATEGWSSLSTNIRDSDGNVLSLSYSRFEQYVDYDADKLVFIFKHLPAGDYFLDLQAFRATDYTIEARTLEDTYSADILTSAHIALGETLESTFAFGSERDWIGFDGVEGQILRFTLPAPSGDIDGYGIQLYDADGNAVELASLSDTYRSTDPITGEQYFTFEVPSTGHYFLSLYGSIIQAFDVPYSVSMSGIVDIPADTGTSLNLTQAGVSVLEEFELAGDSDWIAIDVAGPQTIRFTATGYEDLYTNYIQLAFYDENGTFIGTGQTEYDSDGNLVGNGLLNADHAGRYYVAVSSSLDRAGFYSLSASPLEYGTPVPTSDGTSILSTSWISQLPGATGLPGGLLAFSLAATSASGESVVSVGIVDPATDQKLSYVELGIPGADVLKSTLQSFDGGFVATYVLGDSDTATIGAFATFFDNNGVQQGETILLGTVVGEFSGLTEDMVLNADGTIAVMLGVNTLEGTKLYLIDLATDGSVLDTTIVSETAGEASLFNPGVVLLDNGERLVTWTERTSEGSVEHRAFVDPAGAANVTVHTGPDITPADATDIIASIDGGYVVLSSAGVHNEFQIFDTDGNALTDRISTDVLRGNSGTYDIIGMGDGTFVIASKGPYSVDIMRYDHDGNQVGETTRVDVGASTISNVELTALSGTSFSLSYSSGAGFVVNTFDLPPVFNVLDGGAGAEHLSGSDVADYIQGFGANDMLDGLSGNDSLLSGDGSDHLLGGDGSDRLVGGAGADKLLGGHGADTFVLAADGSTDTISDFDFRMDHLEIGKTASIQDISDLTLTQDGRDLVITGEGLSVRLYNVSQEALNAHHFVFVEGDGFLAVPESPGVAAAATMPVSSPAKLDVIMQLAADPEAAHPVHTMDMHLPDNWGPNGDPYVDVHDPWLAMTTDDSGHTDWLLG